MVSRAFINTQTLVVSSLLGMIIQYRLVLEKENEFKLERLWERDAKEPIKVNALVVDDKRVVIGGLQPDGSGVVEIWQKEQSPL